MVRRVETITLRHVHIASSLLLGCLIHPFLTLFPGTGKAGSSKSRVRHAKNGFFSGLKDADFLKYDGAWPPPAERVLPFQHGMVGPFPLVPHGIEPSSRVSASPGRSGSTVGQFCPRCRANHPVNILPVRFRGDCLGSLQAQRSVPGRKPRSRMNSVRYSGTGSFQSKDIIPSSRSPVPRQPSNIPVIERKWFSRILTTTSAGTCKTRDPSA